MNVLDSASQQPASAPQQTKSAPSASPQQVVDALHGVFGRHQAARAIHAKGVVLDGTFAPSSSASTLSRAPTCSRPQCR